jgi:DNA-binding FrmR family transcriptional regulator
MNYHFEGERLFVDRDPEQMKELVQRLNRVEGQVRGIRSMIEAGRHCRDELQQLNAATAALREIASIVASQHVSAGILCATQDGGREAVMADLLDVLQVALRRG